MRSRRISTRRGTSDQLDRDALDSRPMEEEEILDMLGYSDDCGNSDTLLPAVGGGDQTEESAEAESKRFCNEDVVLGEHSIPETTSAFIPEDDPGKLAPRNAKDMVANRNGEKLVEDNGANGTVAVLSESRPGAYPVPGIELDDCQSAKVDLQTMDVIAYLLEKGMIGAARELAGIDGVDVPSIDNSAEGLRGGTEIYQEAPDSGEAVNQRRGDAIAGETARLAAPRRGSRRNRGFWLNASLTLEAAPTPRRFHRVRSGERQSRNEQQRRFSPVRISLPGAFSSLGIGGTSQNEANNPDTYTAGDLGDSETPVPPSLVADVSSLSMLESGAVTATAVDDIIAVEATKVDPRELQSAPRRQNWRFLVMGGIVLAVAIALVLSIILTVDGGSAVPPTKAPTQRPSMDVESRIELLEKIVLSISGNATQDIDSPHYNALRWMVEDYEGTDLYGIDERIRQRYIMTLLYFQTKGFNWTDTYSFLTSTDECLWQGLSVDEACDREGNIRCIVLVSNNLQGPFPSEIGALTRLETIKFDFNPFLSSSLPSELGNLRNLTSLTLTGCSVNGTLPQELYTLTSLNSVILSLNRLEGTISSDIGAMHGLQHIFLGGNMFTGRVPDEVYSIEDMLEFEIEQNLFTGTISDLIGRVKNLTSYSSFSNQLVGNIPSALGSLRQLTNLQISDMSLSGTIPSELGNLENLSRLSLSYNVISGTLPTDFLKLTNLQKLYLQSTRLTGNISFMCTDSVGPLDPFRADLFEVNCTCCECCYD